MIHLLIKLEFNVKLIIIINLIDLVNIKSSEINIFTLIIKMEFIISEA